VPPMAARMKTTMPRRAWSCSRITTWEPPRFPASRSAARPGVSGGIASRPDRYR
jgi:hypothetical protein